MGVYEERQQQQADDEFYRRAAERLTGTAVSPHATPHRVGDGAYVEVQIFVPRTAMELERWVEGTKA